MTTTHPEATIEADAQLPLIRITRDFRATPAQVLKAHLDPEIFVRWNGPDELSTTIDYWDARDGGSWRYISSNEGGDFAFRGCFHTVSDDKIVQTFNYEGIPDAVALETLTVTDLGDGRTRLTAQSLCDSFEARDAWLSSGMEEGVNAGYTKLDGIVGQI